METSLPGVPDAGDQLLCVFLYLDKLQNRIPLWGQSPAVCFKLKTNTFLIQPLRFKFQWKCRGKSDVGIPESHEYFIINSDQATFSWGGGATDSEATVCLQKKANVVTTFIYLISIALSGNPCLSTWREFRIQE